MTEPLSYRSSLAWAGQVLMQWRTWTRANWRKVLVLSVLGFVVGWAWNTYVIAVDLEGSVIDPETDTAATVGGHSGNAIFWLVLFSLIAGLITYGWTRGWRAALGDAVTLPRRFATAITTNTAATFAMLLWGASISLLISTLISSAVSLALGLVLLTLAATPLGVILNFALIRLWRGLCGIVAPNAGERLGLMVSPFMVMVGEAVGLFLDWMIGNLAVGLVLGLAFAALSTLLVRATPPPRAAALVLMAAAFAGTQFLRMRGAYADDGGWSECTSPDGAPCSGLGGFFDWLRSDGAGAVIAQSSVGGISAGVGTALGVGAGGALASLGAAAAQTIGRTTGLGPQQGGQQAAGPQAPGPAGFPAGDASGQYPGAAGSPLTGGEQLSGPAHAGAPSGEGGGSSPADSGQQPGQAGGDRTSAAGVPRQQGYLPDTDLHDAGLPSADLDTAGLHDAGLHDGAGQAGPASGGQASGTTGHGVQRIDTEIQDLLPEHGERKDREADEPGQPTSSA